MLADILAVLYVAGYLGFVTAGGVAVKRGRTRQAFLLLLAWAAWSAAWFTAAALTH